MVSLGSSPRLWGTLSAFVAAAAGARFIPTPVGNTVRFGPWALCQAVHPHACGEHSLIFAQDMLRHGSSPRLWGTRFHAPLGVNV